VKNTIDDDTQPSPYTSALFTHNLRRRRARQQRLKWYGILAIAIAIGMLGILFASVARESHTAFLQTRIALPIEFDPALFEAADGDLAAAIQRANYRQLVINALYELLGRPEKRSGRRELTRLISPDAGFQLREQMVEHPEWIGQRRVVWLPASSEVDVIAKGAVPRDIPETDRLVSDLQLAWIDRLSAEGRLEIRFNRDLLRRNDSREPEVAGIRGAVIGSALMLFVTLVVTLPIGVAAAIYLEEFAPKNRWTEIIDVNIRNLAAVPSILFGLLGLAVFIRLFGVPRSTPVAGGLVLALLALPTIIVAARAAIHAVPPSLREAALQLGASKMQTTFQVVLPNAMPGILTGTIISMAEALGETAPLLMIGMVAFIAGAPTGFTDPAAPLPVQIYLWSTSPERGFVEKTAAAIVVLLIFLLLMNALAIYLRMRFQKKW
jgi:phosphate transport system permease protein